MSFGGLTMEDGWTYLAKQNPTLLHSRIRAYVLEMHRQLARAMKLRRYLFHAMEQRDAYAAFDIVSRTLGHITQAYQTAWRPPTRGNRGAGRAGNNLVRRRWVRVGLRMRSDQNGKLDTMFRNFFVHFDEKLDEFFARHDKKLLSGYPPAREMDLDKKYPNRTYISVDRFDPHFGHDCDTYFELTLNRDERFFEREPKPDWRFVITGEEFLLGQALRFGNELYDRTEKFLNQSTFDKFDSLTFLDFVMSVDGDIEKAEHRIETMISELERNQFQGLNVLGPIPTTLLP